MPKITDAERALRRSCACGTLLRKDNSDGVCKPCRKSARSTNAEPSNKRGRPLKSQTTPPRNTVAKPRKAEAKAATPGVGIATICVTEQHMDHFWSKLSLEEKANLFQLQLEGVR